MKNLFKRSTIAIISLLAISSCSKPLPVDESPIKQVPFTAVHLEDEFWLPRLETNHEVTIPIAIEQSTISGRIKNFEIAGGEATGHFCSQYPFDDSDIYKIIEAASYSMQNTPDEKMDAEIDELIRKVQIAQEDDGYLFTVRTIDGDHAHPWIGEKWEKLNDLSHELYNLGHLFEAAAAHYQATGKESLLNVAIKAADLVDREFGWGKREDFPGHQEIELGLVKLYNVTGEKRYLDLAKFFLDVRGKVDGGNEYSQSHKPVVEQTEAVGHAVRATYMYAAMADIAGLYNDESYNHANRAIWNDIVGTKTYVTGGIGASGGNEGFSGPYELPNMSAYCETCASVGMVIWNYRMFLADGDAKYYDVLERTLYNAFLSGVSLTGDRFFYPNVLESMGQHNRGKWFGCACCPPNVARLLPSIPGYIYAKSESTVFINLFAQNKANFDFKNQKLSIQQTTNFPWEGSVQININPETETDFTLKVRIPGWAEESAIPDDLYTFSNEATANVKIKVNGRSVKTQREKGYAGIYRTWKAGDLVSIEFPMDVRQIKADDKVLADKNKTAIQRGPIVYCAEWPDNNEGNILSLIYDKDMQTDATFDSDLLNGVEVINTTAKQVTRKVDSTFDYSEPIDITLIPYYSWNNRGAGEMMVWLPNDESSVYPMPAPTIANRSKVTGSVTTAALKVALTDQYEPINSNDHNKPYYHWWPKNDSWEWVQYDFEEAAKVSSSKIYWFDDGPWGGCRIPDDYELQYLENGKWKNVSIEKADAISKDQWNSIKFKPIQTKAMRLRVKLPVEYSAGIHEWAIN